MKKNLVIIFPLVASLIIAGCVVNTGQTNKNTNSAENTNQATTTDQANGNRMDDRFEAATALDLETGKKVMVLGTSNSDGSISAERITIGNSDTNFEDLNPGLQPKPEDSTNSGETVDNNTMPQPSTGQRPDFANMSEEERAKFREQRPNGGAVGPRPDSNSQMTRITGEIVKKEDNILTVKLDSGGSKLIFLSESTSIVKLK